MAAKIRVRAFDLRVVVLKKSFADPVDNYSKKLAHILPTLLAITFGTLIFFVLLRFLLDIGFHVLQSKEEVWHKGIPFFAPWIPVMIWLRPRLRVLTFDIFEDRRRSAFLVTAGATIMIATMMSQQYLTTATGALMEVKRVGDIEAMPPARYYRIESFTVNTEVQGSTAELREYGKRNEKLMMDLYFVCPMVDEFAKEQIPKIWYGVHFQKEIYNDLNPHQQENEYQSFRRRCEYDMLGYQYTKVDHMERVPLSDKLDRYREAVRQSVPAAGEDCIILEPVTKPYDARNGNKLAWIFGSIAIGLTVFMIMLIWPDYRQLS
ncbi:MAG TPA: hypothetical protein PK325_13770 [Cyclobacteriaceae bacterium]|nr:hypothetical protein [Cyclobacteriaceae bacterium]HMV10861.1 hypothetical protein [Cyclobacteriaceae bacterium]HMV91716.1 hypothetical protein [Cyclobacteriaceae bacterium]HMW99698.1 hypothetical protein [Cyclobacteriaceae bacterium]HMX51984.1 hypothetical protein [Cyclobacteriaceae bacterium]